ncbi:MAG: hypothetical protein ABIB71_01065 [Candidatus Woesearchaeota archaeon]
MKFKKEDIGEYVILCMEKDKIAQLLGASSVKVYGRLLDVTETYVEVKCKPPHPLLPIIIKQIPYLRIKNYVIGDSIKNK